MKRTKLFDKALVGLLNQFYKQNYFVEKIIFTQAKDFKGNKKLELVEK